MSTLILLAAVYCAGAVLLHLASIVIAARRCRPAERVAADPGAPGVSVVRPVCGIDNHVEETLRSTFRLDYPDYEVLFCVASARDPVVPLIERLLADFGRARLLIGDDRVSANPKLNNVVKGWRAAKHPWIVIADSNVLLIAMNSPARVRRALTISAICSRSSPNISSAEHIASRASTAARNSPGRGAIMRRGTAAPCRS